jgi:hypothetical protein
MATKKSFVVTCPCCQAKLTIDPQLAEVIAHEAPPRRRSADDLGTAVASLQKQSAEREARFRQQLEAEKKKGQVLDRKFQEGLKRAKDSPDPPPPPLDYD